MGPTDAPPPRRKLGALSSDAWAVLLTQARAALAEVPDDPGQPLRERLRGSSTGRLAGGKGRERLVDLLASDPELWGAVRERLEHAPEGDTVLTALGDDAAGPATDPAVGEGSSDLTTSERASEQARERALLDARRRAERDRAKLKEVRRERDEARRRAEGAARRAEAMAADLAEARDRATHLERRVEELQGQLDAAGLDRDRAVSRERRRRESELAELRNDLAELRRAEERRRERRRRDAERDEQQAEEITRQRPDPSRQEALPRLVPGRPSQLPTGVVPGTREAVELYLHRGRRVLVDGYNVTLQRHGHLDLEQQRSWLVQALANLARARGIEPTVIFDGERSGGRRGGSGQRDVVVRFSDAGITADDEIVLEVEATDEPVLVVTDDRELTDRVRSSGADTIGSQQLLWLL